MLEPTADTEPQPATEKEPEPAPEPHFATEPEPKDSLTSCASRLYRPYLWGCLWSLRALRETLPTPPLLWISCAWPLEII